MIRELPLLPMDESFTGRGYGTLIRMPEEADADKSQSRFALVIPPQKAEGWMLGYLACRSREARVLHCHPDSKETFEPVRGIAALVVAPPDDPEAVEVFILDRPVCLNEGVWHVEITLSVESEIKIVESYAKKSRMPEHALPFAVRVSAVAEP